MRPLRIRSALLPLLLAGGCISPAAHEPDPTLIAQLGVQPAAKELADLVAGARSPRHTDVEVAAQGLSFRSRVGVGRSFVTKMEQTFRVQFANLARVDLFENGKAYLIDANEQSLWRLRFHSLADAKRFADLMFSLKARTGPWPEGFVAKAQPKPLPKKKKKKKAKAKQEPTPRDGN